MDISLKPMSSAPKPQKGEHFTLLALCEWTECGQVVQGWKLIYWVDAFGGMPAGWCSNGHGNFVNAVGWILNTTDLPIK